MSTEQFDAWWRASKYMQVVFSNASTRQTALDGWNAACRDSLAEIAGLRASVGHLSRLCDEQRALLVEVEDVCGRDGHGDQFEDGESELIDKVRAHLGITTPEISQQDTAQIKQFLATNTETFRPAYEARPQLSEHESLDTSEREGLDLDVNGAPLP